MSGYARPLSRRARIMLSVIIWLPLSLMLLGFFGGILWYQEPGSMLVRAVINELGIYI